jgi:malonyl CoA-acyl carrier protein transacylase
MTRNRVVAAAGLVVAALLAIAATSRFGAAQPAPQTLSEPYRVEMVNADPYKVQRALNSLAGQGWYFVSSVNRNDGKVLLIFRHAQ